MKLPTTKLLTSFAEVQPIPKTTFSCLGAEKFGEHIHQLNRNTLTITGIEAHICVAQTALQAISDFTVHVVKDATFSCFVHDWEIASNRMQYNGIRSANYL